MKNIKYKQGQFPNIEYSEVVYSEKHKKYYIVSLDKLELNYQVNDIEGRVIFKSPYKFVTLSKMKMDIRKKLLELGIKLDKYNV